jgi:phthiocerol/phenolphthiocerol synthesis type-I polyketide synthase E
MNDLEHQTQHPAGFPAEGLPRRDYRLLLFATATEKAGRHIVQHLAAYLNSHPSIDIAALEYTLITGRTDFNYRHYLVYPDKGAQLQTPAALAASIQSFCTLTRKPAPVFLFPGGGAQHVNMARRLYDSEPYFKQVVDEGLHYAQKINDADYSKLLYSVDRSDQTELTDPETALPLLFIIEYALAKFLMYLGVVPAAMIGHSLGEYVAACMAGVFTYEDALKIVCGRGRLMKQVEPGLMLSVAAPIEDLASFADGTVSTGAINSPGHCMLSGRKQDIINLQERLQQNDIQAKIIHISVASHSFLMEPILEEFRKVLQSVTINQPTLPFISNLYGDWNHQHTIDVEYWVRHLRETVRFSQGIHTILASLQDCVFIEAGPGHTLSNLVRLHIQNTPAAQVVNLLRHPLTAVDDDCFFLNAVGELWSYGCHIDWMNYFYNGKGEPLLLPPFFQDQASELALDTADTSAAAGRINLAKDKMGKMRTILKK